MTTFQDLYRKKDDLFFVSGHLTKYLTAEIYSVPVLRQAHSRWSDLPFYCQDTIHPDIRDLIARSHNLSDIEIQKRLYTHLITRAIKVLSAYSRCSIPLTDDETVPIRRENLLSDRGKQAFRTLIQAAIKGDFNRETADLALRTTHKFLMDTGYYRDLINTGGIDTLTLSLYRAKTKLLHHFSYIPPIIQLTKGCPNHCSHCFAAAGKHLSYMPYPMWRKIYETLDRHFKYFGFREEYQPPKFLSRLHIVPRKIVQSYPVLDRFFHDSDPATYHDSVINADGGDIALWLKDRGAELYFLTKGIVGPTSARAIAKTASVYPIDISFVDTPREDMNHNIRQLQKTVDLIRSVPDNRGIPRIWNVHLKTGKTVPDSTFMGEHVIDTPIIPSGRANQFPSDLLNMNEKNSTYPYVIDPNGDVILPRCRNTLYIREKLNNIFERQ